MIFLSHLRPVWLRWSGHCLALAVLSVPATLSLAQPSSQPPAGVGVSGLPSLGDGAGMTVAEERRLGDRIASDIYRDPDYLDDPVLVEYLQSIWQPLLGAARARGDVAPELSERLAWELMISRDKRVNAFALPGGYLGVNLGLLAVTDRPEELASVLAHELSHVSQRHIARMIATQERIAPWMLAGMILGALAARSNVDVANAALLGSQAVAAQSQLNFSRDMEREADRVGFGVMTSAGFDGSGSVSMFDKLQQAGRLNDDGAFPYLRSHPLTSERIADMRARLPLAAAGAGTGAAPTNGPLRQVSPGGGAAALTPSLQLHALMAARARVLAENSADLWRSWQQIGSASQASPGDRYAAAYASLRLGQRAQALALAQRLRGEVEVPQQTAVDHLSLEILLTPGAPLTAAEQAQLTQLGAQAWTTGSRTGLLLGAQAAIVGNQAQRASARLLDWVVQHPRDALAWQTLARAHLAQGHTLRAVRAEAESRMAQRDYSGAIDRFRAAQGLPAAERAADPIELAIVDSRRREAEALLREAESDR